MQTFQDRLTDKVIELTARKELLEAELRRLETQITKFSLLAEGPVIPEMEENLRNLFPAPEPIPVIEPVPPPIRAPEDWVVKPVVKIPKLSTRRIIVPGQRIYEITQTNEHNFTLKDVVHVFCQQEQITDQTERERVWAAVYKIMRELAAQQRIVQVEPQYGTRPAVWRKAMTHPRHAFRTPKDISVYGMPLATNTDVGVNGHGHDSR